MIGQTISHYKILDKLGEGGMGVVYLAEDTTLKRQIALKGLPPGLAANREHLDRFQREAEALAALDHPNIVTIFTVEEATLGGGEEYHFLTMQLVKGQQLSDAIPAGGLSLEGIFSFAIPLADALAAAHENGVIHRDLKPANIMVTDRKQIKVLDFGLAKLRLEASPVDATDLPTSLLTEAGSVFGTMPYMSPEQIQGKDVDHRTDIFSLGDILFEMIIGERPFHGETSADLISSILRDTPRSIDTLRADLPHHLGRIVRHCLVKDAQGRFQTARDVYNELSGLQEELTLVPGGTTRKPGPASAEPSEIRAVAVLPLENLSGDQAQEYFADGMTEALITDLAKIGALKVISRTSVMQFKGVHKPLPQIAAELGVDAVIEGSVLRIDDSVRIATQLIDARNDKHLWAENYDYDVRDVLLLMSEVARNVADRVRVQLTKQEQSLLATTSQVDPEAHELYLKGRYLLGRMTREGADQAQELMRAAIEIDPGYAQAHAGLADARLTFVLFGWQDYSEGLPRVRSAVEEALALDYTLADAHAILASVDARERHYEQAEAGFRRAIDLSPNHARAHGDYSNLLVWLNRLEEAIGQARRALALEPLSLKSGIDLMSALYYARRYDAAERQTRELLALHPGAPYAEWCLGVSLAQQGRYDDAIETFLGRQVPTAATNWALGYIYGITGRREKAQEVLNFLLEKSQKQFVSPAMIAYVHLGLGDRDTALDLLEATFEEKGGRLIYLQVDPWLDCLRDDPRFQDLVRRMNFPKPL